MGGTHFQNEEKVMIGGTEYFGGKCDAYYWDDVFKLLIRWGKCINLNGNYKKKK